MKNVKHPVKKLVVSKGKLVTPKKTLPVKSK